jgi:hypothetical protein
VDRQWFLRAYDLEEILPWDNMDAGLTRRFLELELKRAQRGVEVEDCKWGTCYSCGIPGKGDDIKLAAPDLPTLAPDGSESLEPEARPRAAAYRQRPAPLVLPRPELAAQPERTIRYRLSVAKEGDARFLSHRNLMDLLERALRGSGVPVRYTQGFNPRVRMHMGPALTLGVESRHEIMEIETWEELDAARIAAIGERLVKGVALLGAERVPDGAPKLSKTVAGAIYLIQPPEGEDPEASTAHPALIDLRREPGGAWRVMVNLDERRGPALAPRPLLEQLFGVRGDDWQRWRIVRTRTLLHEVEAPVDSAPAGSGS